MNPILDINNKEVGRRIARLFNEHDLGVIQISKELGHKRQVVDRWITGESIPSGPGLKKICHYFDVDYLHVLYGKEFKDLEKQVQTVGERLCLLRTQRGLTRSEAGNLIGVPGLYIYHWESGRTNPGIRKIFDLSCLYNVSVCYIEDGIEASSLTAMSVGQRIVYLRRQKGLEQKDLANLLGVLAPAISLWELDISIPNEASLKELSRILNVTPSVILHGKPKDNLLKDAQSAGERIAILRFERFLNQTQLAAVLKVSKQSVAFWENGSRIPSGAKLRVLADYFEVCPLYLTHGKDFDLLKNNAKTFGEQLSLLRMAQGMKLFEIGCLANISAGNFAAWETNKEIPAGINLKRLRRYLTSYGCQPPSKIGNAPMDSCLESSFAKPELQEYAKAIADNLPVVN